MAVSQFSKSWYVSSLNKVAAVDLHPCLKCLSCLLQMVRSAISWAVTDALGRAQHITPDESDKLGGSTPTEQDLPGHLPVH